MQPIFYWVIGYLAPMLVTYLLYMFLLKKTSYGKNHWVSYSIIHSGLALSIVINAYFLYQHKLTYLFHPTWFSIPFLLLTSLASIHLLGELGPSYLLSSLLQQFCVPLSIQLLLQYYSIPFLLVLLVPPYVIAHIQHPHHWKSKVPPTTAWGLTSVLLYCLTSDLLLNTAFHILIGTHGIKKRILYDEMEI